MTLIAAQKEPQMGQIEEQLNQNPFISAGETFWKIAEPRQIFKFCSEFCCINRVPVQRLYLNPQWSHIKSHILSILWYSFPSLLYQNMRLYGTSYQNIILIISEYQYWHIISLWYLTTSLWNITIITGKIHYFYGHFQ